MKNLLITTALCLAATTAWAGGSGHDPAPTPSATTYNATGAVAGAAAHSQASAGATAQGGRATARTGPVTVNNNPGGGYGGGYSARGNTPDVILPAISGGNPCGLAAGAGGAFQAVGAMFAKMWEGEGCETREGAKLLYNMGYESAAKNRLCEDTHYSTAFANAGEPCAADARRWTQDGYRSDGRGGWAR